MKNFRNIVYSETPPNINDLWLKGTLDSDDPFEIRIFKMGKWEIIDKGSLALEDSKGTSENSTMTQKAITEALDSLQNQIDNINPNDFNFYILPIENKGTYENVEATIVIENASEYSNIVLCNTSTNTEKPLSNGENNVIVNITQKYQIKYSIKEVVIVKDVAFTLTDPLFFGLYNGNIQKLNPEILGNLKKEVSNSLDRMYPNISNSKQTYFYIIIPTDNMAWLTSNGFFIPLSLQNTQPYLNTSYCIYKSGLLDEGPLTNINIKIIKK